jgi:hypothetical protein
MQPLIAIDPGASGGIAVRKADGYTFAAPMPDGMSAQIDLLREVAAANPGATSIMERVGGYMPGNSGPAACKFARHCGHIEAALYSIGIPCEQVAPAKWQRAIGTWPAVKQDRKRAIREHMARLHPSLTVTLKTADALAILHYRTQYGVDTVRPHGIAKTP